MKRVAAILLTLCVAAFVFCELCNVAVYDGWYDLTVEIAPDAAAGISGVSYMCANSAEMVDAIVATVDEQVRFMDHQETVEPLTVRIGFSYRASNLGWTWGHHQQYSHIIVVLDRVDGSRTVHRLAIPHRDDSRRIIVTRSNAT